MQGGDRFKGFTLAISTQCPSWKQILPQVGLPTFFLPLFPLLGLQKQSQSPIITPFFSNFLVLPPPQCTFFQPHFHAVPFISSTLEDPSTRLRRACINWLPQSHHLRHDISSSKGRATLPETSMCLCQPPSLASLQYKGQKSTSKTCPQG